MKNAFYFILGVCLVVLTSATTVSVMTIKPVEPKSTIVYWSESESSIRNQVRSLSQSGYTVKCLVSENGGTWMVIMEKY
jgi:hypothetical protein